MVERSDNEKLMERYLLGLLPEAEAVRLEERGLADDEFFAQLQVVEDRLVDSYVTGRLALPEREQFERQYLTSPLGRERVAFARALLATVALPEVAAEAGAAQAERPKLAVGPAWRERLREIFRVDLWTMSLAAVSLLLLLFAGWSWLEARRARADLLRERVALEQRARELQAQLADRQGERETLSREVEELKRRSDELERQLGIAQTDVAFIALLPPDYRGATPAATPKLVLTPAKTKAQFTLLVTAAVSETIRQSYPNVRATLVRDGKDHQTLENLRLRRVKSGHAFVITLPAANLEPGSYHWELFASGPSGKIPAGDYSFEVTKR